MSILSAIAGTVKDFFKAAETINTEEGHIGLALLSVVLICIEYWVISGAVGNQRGKLFNKEYMAKYNPQHIKDFPNDKEVPKGGYPDMGNGRYAESLTYAEWFKFNNYQRTHYNYLESLTPVIIWILISCAYKPLAAAILGYIYLIGRLLYCIGYWVSPTHRNLGAWIFDLAYIALFILTLVTIGNWGNFL